MSNQTDRVDDIIAQWHAARPDLRSGLPAMALLGRLNRCNALLAPQLGKIFAEYGLNFGEFDVLATLRRAGAPFILSPTALYATLMVSSGTMTHRLKILENRGLISRLPNPDDSRSQLVQLSGAGKTLIDQAVTAHLANENALLSNLSDAEKQALDTGLRALLREWESGKAD
ncbi:Multiple antibiotic resistance protein marR [Kingella potus]|uniref:Multiple antibiotic resistance protein marR n=1 Tax=Kingella potus TaxID=265175 RepID=A0A377R4Q9_9NEIS|nr:MarR family transcriptional regulator [Kingella potus]UOO99974.1 MarR family transcriptional regulator [Kingella potus]STR03259.1 Multiple antibiotic resistance protein marR [Kingella potus]